MKTINYKHYKLNIKKIDVKCKLITSLEAHKKLSSFFVGKRKLKRIKSTKCLPKIDASIKKHSNEYN